MSVSRGLWRMSSSCVGKLHRHIIEHRLQRAFLKVITKNVHEYAEM